MPGARAGARCCRRGGYRRRGGSPAAAAREGGRVGARHGHATPARRTGGGCGRVRAVGAYFVVELVAGLVSGSLALLSDAGHMAADVVALGAALVATRIATRPDRTGRTRSGPTVPRSSRRGWPCCSCWGSRSTSSSRPSAHRCRAGPREHHDARCRRDRPRRQRCRPRPAARRAAESLTSRAPTSRSSPTRSGRSGHRRGPARRGDRSAVWDTAVALAIAAFVAVRALFLAREVSPSSVSTRPPASTRPTPRRPCARWPTSSTCTTCTCGRSRRG